MFVSKNNFPRIVNALGVAIVFEDDWLKAALDRAALKAGYNGWWLSEDFSAAVSQYFRQVHASEDLEISKLERIVRAALRDTGYSEIATRFRATNPFQHLSLVSYLRTSGRKREAVFSRRLKAKIGAFHTARVQLFHFCDLQECVTELVESESSPSWWAVPMMRAYIIGFVRDRIRELPWQSRTLCTIR